MIGFLVIGFQPSFNDLTIQQIPEWIATYRSISLFLIAWYIIVSAFILHYGIQETKCQNKAVGILNILSIFLAPSLISLFYLLSQTTVHYINLWLKHLFASDTLLKTYYTRRSWQYIMMIFVLIIMAPIVFFIFYRDNASFAVYPQNGEGQVEYYTNWWFNSLQYFTIQINSFSYLFVILFVIYPSWRLFKYHSFLIYAISYLLIVGVTYDFILLPTHIVSGSIKSWNTFDWVSNVWEHMIDPLVFCSCGIILLCQIRNFACQDYLTTLKFGMIIPTVYIAFGLCNCFVTNESVYGWFTNCNPELWNNLKTSNAFMKHGEPYICFIFFIYWGIFVGVLTGFWSVDQVWFLKKPKSHYHWISLKKTNP